MTAQHTPPRQDTVFVAVVKELINHHMREDQSCDCGWTGKPGDSFSVHIVEILRQRRLLADPPLTFGPTRTLTLEQCRSIGGHCWQADPFEMVDAVAAGIRHRIEICKHCPTTRTGVSREPWVWTVQE